MRRKRNRRWRLLADAKLQGALCLRLAVYWVICQLSVVGTMLAFHSLSTPQVNEISIWSYAIPALFTSSVLLPLALFDFIAASNRFVGPIAQLRKKLNAMAESKTTEHVGFRTKDYYQDVEKNFNAICDHFDKLAETPEYPQQENVSV